MGEWAIKYLKEFLSIKNMVDYKNNQFFTIEKTSVKLSNLVKDEIKQQNLLDLEDELKLILNVVSEIKFVQYSYVYILDKKGNSFRKDIGSKEDKNQINEKIPISNKLVKAVIKTKKHGTSDDLEKLNYRKSYEDVKSIAIFPIYINHRLMGLFIVETKEPKISSYGINLFSNFSIIIKNTIQHFVDSFLMKNRAQIFQLFFEVNEVLNIPQSKQEIYDFLSSMLSTLFECDRVVISSFDLKNSKAKIEKIFGMYDVLEPGQIIKGFSNIQQAIIDTKLPLFIENLSDSAYGQRFNLTNIKNENLFSIILVPIITHERVIGSFSLEFKKEGMINENYFTLFSRLGRMIGSSVEKIQLYKKMEKMATTDYLTDLLLKREFVKILKNELERSRRSNISLALLMIDVDKFKFVNDNYGHISGDIVLKQVAKIIRSSIRNTEYASRYAGDEFCVILLNNTIAQAQISAERIRKNVEEFPIYTDSGKKINITLSIGISIFNKRIKSYKDLIREADFAMYKGRLNGNRNVTTLYDHDIDKINK